MPVARFMPRNSSHPFTGNPTVAEVAEAAGLSLDLPCGGRGKCGKCNVTIQEEGEKAKEVLACRHRLSRDTLITIPRRLLRRDIVSLTGSSMKQARFNPAVKKVFVRTGNVVRQNGEGDFETLGRLLQRDNLIPPALKALSSLPESLRYKEGVTAVLYKDEVLALEKGDTASVIYGAAVDIGTTTVVVYLYNLKTGKQVAVTSALNRQVEAGADVMTRIMAAETLEGLAGLRQRLLDTLNGLIRAGCRQAGIKPENIFQVVLVGNSVMQQLFFALPTSYLGRTPFTPAILRRVTVSAGEAGLAVNPAGKVVFLPLIGGFVGADTTAVLLAAGFRKATKLRLVIDIGTNGEMVLGNKDGLLACSTAAGPALEGAGITFGMRGVKGAIEDVSFWEGEVNLKIIGGGKASGICGSGLVACVAELLKAGLLNSKGRLLDSAEYRAAGGHPLLAERLQEVGGQRVFILCPAAFTQESKDIYLSQTDVRAVQLAKGAIAAGVSLLLEESRIEGKDLAEILLAGAFGNYIDVRKGQTIGLVPDFPGVPVRPVGNAAGAGAQKALLSRPALDEADNIGKTVRHLDLAGDPNFQKRFIESLLFPPVTGYAN